MVISKREAEERKRMLPVENLERLIDDRPAPPSFGAALSRKGGVLKVIAEVKRASPSAGRIRGEVDPYSLVDGYRRAGAAAASIITCGRYFEGSLEDLKSASNVEAFPILRKDFVSNPYQVLESRAFGASSVLLISDALEEKELKRLIALALSIDLEPLVEVHTYDALAKALFCGAEIIGINNRDLKTLEVDLSTTERLIRHIPEGFAVVSESGIKTSDDARRMEMLGVDALLIGEALMRAEDPERALSDFISEIILRSCANAGSQPDLVVRRKPK